MHKEVEIPLFIHSCTARERSLGQGNMFIGVCLSTGRGLCPGGSLSRGISVQGGLCHRDPPSRYGERAGGTHPTEMHSCLFSVVHVFLQISQSNKKRVYRNHMKCEIDFFDCFLQYS